MPSPLEGQKLDSNSPSPSPRPYGERVGVRGRLWVSGRFRVNSHSARRSKILPLILTFSPRAGRRDRSPRASGRAYCLQC